MNLWSGPTQPLIHAHTEFDGDIDMLDNFLRETISALEVDGDRVCNLQQIKNTWLSI